MGRAGENFFKKPPSKIDRETPGRIRKGNLVIDERLVPNRFKGGKNGEKEVEIAEDNLEVDPKIIEEHFIYLKKIANSLRDVALSNPFKVNEITKDSIKDAIQQKGNNINLVEDDSIKIWAEFNNELKAFEIKYNITGDIEDKKVNYYIENIKKIVKLKRDNPSYELN